MGKSLSISTVSYMALLLFIVNILGVHAVTYPVGVPSGEVAGGTFNTYFTNMFGNPGLNDASPNYAVGCGLGLLIRGFSSTGMVLCVSPGLGSTSSATLSLSGTLVGTPNYIAKYTPTGTGINNSQIFDNGTNVGIANTSPSYKLDVAGTGSFYGVRISSGAVNGYVLTTDASGLATWAIAPSPCITPGSGVGNICYGYRALQTNTTGFSNTANGYEALYLNTTGYNNSAFGHTTLSNNTTGGQNTGLGSHALFANTTGFNNTAVGTESMQANVNGMHNSALGYWSLRSIISGNWNTGLGYYGGNNLISGDNNTAVGANTNFINTAGSNQLNIANIIFGTGLTGTVGAPVGNVGIGTATPTAKLEVAGQVKITGGNPGVGKTLTSDATGLATWTDTVSGSTATGIVSGAGNQNYVAKFGSGGVGIYSSQLYDDNTNIGIGTITPGAKLEVAGQIKITGGSPGANKVLSSDASGLATWVSLSSVSGVWSLLGNSGTVAGTNFIGTTDNQSLVFKANNLEFMRALVSGDVGIGTATPGARLEVAGQVKITGGSPSLGRVLTSDATGLATWTTAPVPCIATGTGADNTCYGSGSLQLNTVGVGNTANGSQTLFSNTTGQYNTAIGTSALRANVSGIQNTANGNGALFSNTTGGQNTANGNNSLYLNTTGFFNTANGQGALSSNSTGSRNTAIGGFSLLSNNGDNNTANGASSLYSNTTGSNHTAIGYQSAFQIVANGGTTPNTAIGYQALYGGSGTASANTAYDNVAIGYQALYGTTGIASTGYQNVAVGNGALKSNTTGVENSANGYRSLFNNATGNSNTANGNVALFNNTSGNFNTTNGASSLYNNTTGSQNTVNGYASLFNNTTGSNNIAYGFSALNNNTSGSNHTAIGYQSASQIIANGGATPNTAIGYQALYGGSGTASANTAYDNVAIGYQALYGSLGIASTGYQNVAVGNMALQANSTGYSNTANGYSALTTNNVGRENTANGFYAMRFNTTGNNNVADGGYALYFNTVGSRNVANGFNSMGQNTVGGFNTAVGYNSLYSNTGGFNNSVLGYQSLGDNTTASNNTAIGYNTARGITTGVSNTIIGANVVALAPTLSNNIIIADGDGNQRINVTSTGNVGIGTSTPTAKLEVAGQVKIAATGAYLDYRPNAVSCSNGQILSWNNASTRWECSSNAPGISGSGLTTNYITKWNGTSIADSQLFDNGTNVGIGTALPGSKLEVVGNSYFNGNVTVSGSLIVDKIVNRTVTNVSVSGSLLPDVGAPLVNRDIGLTGQRWNNLYLSGQISIGGGSPGLGKILTSDANGLATWSNTPVLANTWNIIGNSGTVAGTNFIGTTDNQSLVFKANNLEFMRALVSGDVGIGTATPGAKLEVAGQIKITGGIPGTGKVLTSDASGLAVWSSTVSGSTATGITGGTQNYIPKFGTGGTGLYLSQFFDNGTNVGIGTATPGAKLEVAGQIKITGGVPGVGKILVSDATGLATWTGVVTATGININGATLGSTLFYDGTAWTAGTGIYNTGGNIGIGTTVPTSRLTIDSGTNGSGGLRLSRISATTTPYSGPNIGLGVDGSGNLVPVSNGDVVVYTAKGRSGVQPTPDPDLPNRAIGYNFNTYFAIPTSQSFVVSDGNGAGYNAPYFKENGVSGICSGGGSPYDCAVADPFTGLSASPNNSFTMTAKGTTYGYQMALGARGDAPLFARSGKFVGSQTGGLYLSDNVTPTPWQKVLTVPANHLEYFYVNIGYNSQLQAIAGGGNVGIGTSVPDRRLVISGSGSTTSATQQVQIRRGIQGADASLSTTYGTPYMNIGGQENRVNSLQTIGFGKSGLGAAGYAPAEIGFLTTSVTGFTQGDIIFANRNGTTNVAPTEVMRIESTGDVGIGVTNPTQQLQISRSMSVPMTTSSSVGVIYRGATRYEHNYTSSAFAPNIFLGLNAGNFTMTQGYNIGIGDSALALNTTGFSNMALGYLALSNNTTGGNNAAIGSESLELNQTGNNNVANGFKSLYANISGGNNTSIGTESLTANDIGSNNTANGYQALNANTSGNSNTAIGGQSLFTNVSGQFNTAVGYQALRLANSPSNNTAIGYLAGNTITTGASNIVIGSNAQVGSPTGSNQLSIGNWLYGSGGNIGIGIAAPTAKLEVAGNFKLGTNGTVTTAAGVCTIASTAISTTATTYTCTGVPASTAVAINCSAAAAFTTPNSTSLYCRANGTLNQVVCNTTVVNAVATTYKCMWMQ